MSPKVVSMLLGEQETGSPWPPYDLRPDGDPVLDRHMVHLLDCLENGGLYDLIEAIDGLSRLELIRLAVAAAAACG